ncbi:hypothetical protein METBISCDRAFT_25668 [Metschnikowia bicuspidata]|uniref:Dilute domain-containing protein n=1 Tax=Metschnikowia bicuspidata TaxID=27322 RepID=A0A4P9ZJ82_9ASCO|nr:hypothetical protein METBISCDRAFT_25668 [Metschnikowia bicuspidata]
MGAWEHIESAPFGSDAQPQRLDPLNVLHGPLLAARAELTPHAKAPESDGSEEPPEDACRRFFRAVCDGDVAELCAAVSADSVVVRTSFHGFPPLVLAVVFDRLNVAEKLLDTYSVDPDTPDLVKMMYSPLMWAVHFDNLAMVQLLLQYQADPHYALGEAGTTAASLVSVSGSAVYEYFRSHNLLNALRAPDALVFEPRTFGLQLDYEDDLAYKIQMLSIEASADALESGAFEPDASRAGADELDFLPFFDYTKALPGQYIKYTDSDVASLIDYIFAMRLKSHALQHDARAPAAVVFQLMHYSHDKARTNELTAFLFECFVSRIRSVTNTKSGVVSSQTDPAAGTGDIVLLSYWLAVAQFLHLHLTRAGVYKRHPDFLQTLISITQGLIGAISFSINNRLDILVDDCVLDYTTLVDVATTNYAKDWNFLKLKRTPNSYDDILDMLYPPSEEELMLPSPHRYLQVLAALDYVLHLHLVHPLLRFQTYSQVFYYINATMFNRVILNTKYCSRVKAVQIRLNVSAIEDWLRSHNSPVFKPETLGGLARLVDDPRINFSALLSHDDAPNDPHCLGFLYTSLYHIGRVHLNPLIELLQWLQVVTGLQDEETFIITIKELESLNYYQLYKVTKKMYRYEVNEPKVPKTLVQGLKKLMEQEGQNQVDRLHLSYLSQTSFLLKELYIYINPNYVFGVALPNLNELVVSFGAGLGGIKKNAKKYQPHLPTAVADDVDEILMENANTVNASYDYDKDSDDVPHVDEDAEASTVDRLNMLFKKLVLPLVAHANYNHDDIDVNPW